MGKTISRAISHIVWIFLNLIRFLSRHILDMPQQQSKSSFLGTVYECTGHLVQKCKDEICVFCAGNKAWRHNHHSRQSVCVNMKIMSLFPTIYFHYWSNRQEWGFDALINRKTSPRPFCTEATQRHKLQCSDGIVIYDSRGWKALSCIAAEFSFCLFWGLLWMMCGWGRWFIVNGIV